MSHDPRRLGLAAGASSPSGRRGAHESAARTAQTPALGPLAEELGMVRETTMGQGYYILDGHTPVEVADVIEWARWFESSQTTAARRVALTDLPNGGRVSTVFLGADHNWTQHGPPLLFETMLFAPGDAMDNWCQRCSTWDEAEAQHAAMVAKFSEPQP